MRELRRGSKVEARCGFCEANSHKRRVLSIEGWNGGERGKGKIGGKWLKRWEKIYFEVLVDRKCRSYGSTADRMKKSEERGSYETV